MAKCPKCGGAVDENGYRCGSCGCEIIEGINEASGEFSGPRGFNFGAFVFGGFWALANGLWAVGIVGLFVYCLPLVNVVFALWMGFAGNGMAWNKRRNKNLARFRAEQWAWSIAAVIAIITVGKSAYKIYDKFSYRDSDRFVTCLDRMISVQEGERRYRAVHGEYTKNMDFLDYYLIADCENEYGCGGQVMKKVSQSCGNVELRPGPGGLTQSFLASGSSRDELSCAICVGPDPLIEPATYKSCSDRKTTAQRCEDVKAGFKYE